MSTKSFIINLPIITGDQDRRRLRKSFSFGCNLQNAVMGGGWDRVLKMRATAEWQTARAMPKSSERTKAFRDLRVRFRLSEYDFHADVAMHRKASGRGHLLGINECQKLASRAWISVERHLYNGGSPRFISSRRGLHSIEGKTNRTGIIWKADQQCVTVCKHVYRVRVDKRDDWLTRALQDPTDPTKPRKVKYCRIVREMRKGKERFLLQLVAEGTSPLKHAYAGKDQRMAIDPGLGSLTYATEDGKIAKVQIAPNADTDHRAVRRIQRAMERSRQATNPDNYETVDVVRHGKKRQSLKVKSGRLEWRFSKRYEKLRAELAQTHRLAAATRKREHGEVCNWLLSHAGTIIVEDNSFKAFQRGQFGKSIGRHAPAAFYTQLTSKAESAGLQVKVVSPKKLKPTQHNLLTGRFVKHELWERRVQLGDRTGVCWIDRDAAACVNLLYADLDQQIYDPKRIREAVLAGVTAWLDAGVVVIQAREGITEREFRRFRRRGIPSLAVQGLRQKGFRGRSDSKSGAIPEAKSLSYIETFPL